MYNLVVLYQLALVSPSYTPPGKDLDSTFHYSHMLHCDMMEQDLVADTGRVCLSSQQYCCMPPQLLHWPEWEDLHSRQCWLESKMNTRSLLTVYDDISSFISTSHYTYLLNQSNLHIPSNSNWTLHVLLNLATVYKQACQGLVSIHCLPMHTRVTGFGVQVPFGDIPSDVHTAVILPVGTNPVLHLKIISVPPSVLGTATMEPLPGAIGIPQLTGRRGNDNEKRNHSENNKMLHFFPLWCKNYGCLGLVHGEWRLEERRLKINACASQPPTLTVHPWS